MKKSHPRSVRKKTTKTPLKKLDLSEKSLNQVKKAAIEAALKAGAILRKNFGGRLDIREKPGAGLVTQIDIAAENAAMKVLRKACPSFETLAEESGSSASLQKGVTSEGRWVIDPLDGTTNFVHAFPMFCVSIAAEIQSELAVGVIYHPILNDLYVAVRGQGSTVNGRKIQVSKTKSLRNSLLTTGFTYRKDDWLHQEMVAFEKLSAVARAIRRPGSAALDLAYTARGVFDGFWERRLSPWDVAAGTLLVREAGGTVTDLQGGEFSILGDALLASNGQVHGEILDAVRG